MSEAEFNWSIEINVHEFEEYKWIISIGSGVLESSLRERIAKLRLSDSAFILPYMANPFPILKHADVFVLSSRYEGYGNILLESMALSVPVVSVDCLAGPREILNDNTDYKIRNVGWEIAKRGILVTNNESERTGETRYLADAIEVVLNDKELRNRIVSTATKWIENHSNMDILQQWTGCIEKALENNRRKPKRIVMPTKEGHYVIYGAGIYAKKIYKELQKEGIDIDAFIVSNTEGVAAELFGRHIYQREILLNNDKKYKIIMGVVNWEYANQICKWFLDNNINNVLFYSLSKREMEV